MRCGARELVRRRQLFRSARACVAGVQRTLTAMASMLAGKAMSNPAVQKAVKGKVGAAVESLE